MFFFFFFFAVLKGRNLVACDDNGKSDPYVTFTWRGKKKRTHTVYKSLNPVWEKEAFVLGDFDDNEEIALVCWDKDRLSSGMQQQR
jgi:Ca2+-dependent lipid-binding protein